jgi:hypothetical protein
MISPAILDPITGMSSYNLSQSHSDFADNYLYLHQYLKYNKPPAYMWFYVTPESFDTRFNTFNSFRFSAWLEDDVIRETVCENDRTYGIWSALPFMRFGYYNRHELFNVMQGYWHLVTDKSMAYYPDGFEPPAKRVWGNHNGEFVELYEQDILFKWDAQREKYFLKTIDLALGRGIKVVLYESPVLADALSHQPNRGVMVNRIRRMADSLNVPFVQFENLEMARDRRNFVSTLNFSMRGVETFNPIFAEKVVEYCK